MKRPNISKQIKESGIALKVIMQEGLSEIADNLVADVMNKVKHLTDGTALDAIKGIELKGTQAYKQKLLNALSVVAREAIDQAKSEIPGGRKMRFAEFDSLPIEIQKLVKTQTGLILETQGADLKKVISFQYTHSFDTTDSLNLIEEDLADAAADYISGVAITSGSATIASQVVNSARKAFFLEDEIQEAIEAFEFINGDPVTEICASLNHTVFFKDDPESFRYWPPLHYNCESHVIPVKKGDLRGREIVKLKPATARLESMIQLSENEIGFSDLASLILKKLK